MMNAGGEASRHVATDQRGSALLSGSVSGDRRQADARPVWKAEMAQSIFAFSQIRGGHDEIVSKQISGTLN